MWNEPQRPLSPEARQAMEALLDVVQPLERRRSTEVTAWKTACLRTWRVPWWRLDGDVGHGVWHRTHCES